MRWQPAGDKGYLQLDPPPDLDGNGRIISFILSQKINELTVDSSNGGDYHGAKHSSFSMPLH